MHLLSVGADVNTTRSFDQYSGITSLHAAAARGHVTVMAALLGSPDCDVNRAMSDGTTALHCAVEFLQRRATSTLLGHPAVIVSPVKSIGRVAGVTPLHLAAAVSGNDEILRDRNDVARDRDDSSLAAAGHDEIWRDLVEISRDLVAGGADVNARSSDGFTALHWAARRGACAVVAVLLASGADVGARATFVDCSDVTALHLAVSDGHLDVVDQLIAADKSALAAVYRAADTGHLSALHMAAVSRQPEVVRRLIDVGCDVTAVTSSGSTPLGLAVMDGNSDVAEILTEVKISKINV